MIDPYKDCERENKNRDNNIRYYYFFLGIAHSILYYTHVCTFTIIIVEYERNEKLIIGRDCCRTVAVDAGQELSLRFGCQFYEVSAAENFAGVSLAFHSLLRETRAVQLLRGLPIRRKLGVNSVSKVLGTIFGKNSSKRDRKKRPSLSI